LRHETNKKQQRDRGAAFVVFAFEKVRILKVPENEMRMKQARW